MEKTGQLPVKLVALIGEYQLAKKRAHISVGYVGSDTGRGGWRSDRCWDQMAESREKLVQYCKQHGIDFARLTNQWLSD